MASVQQPSRAPPPRFHGRLALGAYTADPSSSSPSSSSSSSSTVIYRNDDFVAIHDKYPKATVHALLLPRSAAHNLLHPFEAFRDAAFLAAVQAETARLRALVAAELQRRLGRYSRSERQRQAVLDGVEEEPPPAQGLPLLPLPLPPGRDWAAEVICGVHAVPSMSHLHVHVLSRDMRSGCVRHRKHYNSFTTPFFVDLMDFPLREGDARLDPRGGGYLRSELRCWRCGKGFGNAFARLKEHLEGEFVSWRAE
ncbi:hypothetical protein UVI_02021480 [Ustilaginoidea virens]|nr:hypothetical protein UVI_02021480 [Ustilaginoidea virens]